MVLKLYINTWNLYLSKPYINNIITNDIINTIIDNVNKNYDEVAGELSNLEYDDDGNIVNIATMVSVITILNSN